MKISLKASLIVGLALAALAVNANAQTPTILFNGAGSSAMFLELGLAAGTPASSSPAGLGIPCLWSGAGASITDTSTGTSLTDTGNAWVAWTTGTGSCAAPVAPYNIYAYLQTDSVVGNRCLFNGSSCTATYPSTNPVPANLIFPAGSSTPEVNLPAVVAAALTGTTLDTAGSDIRPEDAEFAITRALASCGSAVGAPSYLGLGYTNGSRMYSSVTGSTFNVINFGLPANYTATVLGATPIVVVANNTSSSTGFNDGVASYSISSAVLAKFLDGTYSYADQTVSPTGTGAAVDVAIREPLSGTYNTMEYNVPNTINNSAVSPAFVGNYTSQDVGQTQLAAQANCGVATAPSTFVPFGSNPMNISTASGGARLRAIGTGQELSVVQLGINNGGTLNDPSVTATGTTLGYGFWSVANFKNFTSTGTPYAKYFMIDGYDPIYPASHTFTGAIPTSASDLANVTLDNVADGNYPIWSMLRLVNASSSATAATTALATASRNFVPTGTTSARPDFVEAGNLSVVRSHFSPPAGVGQPATTAVANGFGSDSASKCTAPELGGDVGGVVYALTTDSTYCTKHGPRGETGERK